MAIFITTNDGKFLTAESGAFLILNGAFDFAEVRKAYVATPRMDEFIATPRMDEFIATPRMDEFKLTGD